MVLLELHQTNELALKDVMVKKSVIKFPQDAEIKELTSKTDSLDIKQSLLNSVVRNDNEILKVSSELSKIVLPELNSEAMEGKIGTLDTLKTVINQQNEANIREKDILTKIADTDIELKEYVKQLNELIESTDICPLCNQNMGDDCKHQLKEV